MIAHQTVFPHRERRLHNHQAIEPHVWVRFRGEAVYLPITLYDLILRSSGFHQVFGTWTCPGEALQMKRCPFCSGAKEAPGYGWRVVPSDRVDGIPLVEFQPGTELFDCPMCHATGEVPA